MEERGFTGCCCSSILVTWYLRTKMDAWQFLQLIATDNVQFVPIDIYLVYTCISHSIITYLLFLNCSNWHIKSLSTQKHADKRMYDLSSVLTLSPRKYLYMFTYSPHAYLARSQAQAQVNKKMIIFVRALTRGRLGRSGHLKVTSLLPCLSYGRSHNESFCIDYMYIGKECCWLQTSP
jgi:hypothetical protein